MIGRKALPGLLKIFIFMFFVLCCGIIFSCAVSEQSGWKYADHLAETIAVPVFPDKEFDITQFGAVGDGITDCTAAIHKAIIECTNTGGGRVIVPAGKYFTGAIHLENNVNLYVSYGAVLLFSTNPENYLPLVYTRWEGVECMNYSSLIYAFQKENVAITGMGTLDGQSDNTHWWPWKGRTEYGWTETMPQQEPARQRLFAMAAQNVPVDQRIMGDGAFLRPQFVQFIKCKNVHIEGVTIQNSPMWLIHPVLCNNVLVENVRMTSHGPNNDGCDPESSKNVLIKNSYFDTGDDCIAIKSGRNEDGRKINIPSENILVQNCVMQDGHGGVVVGSEISGNARNIFVRDCVMDSPALQMALRIKTNSLRGGIVENIYFKNIRVGQVSEAIVRVNLNYEEGDIGEYAPIVRNIYLENVSSMKSSYALKIEGYKRSPVKNIQLKNCTFENVENQDILENVKNLVFKNVYVNGSKKLY